MYDDAGHAILIDPGFYTTTEEQELLLFIQQQQLSIDEILLTHAHIDHILGLKKSVTLFNKTPYLHVNETMIFEEAHHSAKLFGLAYEHYSGAVNTIQPTTRNIESSLVTFQIINAPGHSPGSVCFYIEEHHTLIAGDVLFLESVGRTDLPGGDFKTLLHSIKTELFTLPPETKVFPGHGAATYIGYEKEYNPFCKQ